MGLDDIFTDTFNNAFSIILTIIVALSTFFSLLLVTLPKQYDPYEDKAVRFVDEKGEEIKVKTRDGKDPPRWKQGRTVQIVVLGDIGRSPRANRRPESEIHPDIVSNRLIKIISLVPAPDFLRSSSKLLFPILAPLKALWQAWSLYKALGYRSEPGRWMLVQNPPSIPTLAIAGLVSFLRNTELVIDWHNFGYSILALKLGTSHPLVKISEWYEKVFAKSATHHVTVTNAMERVLKNDYGVSAQALHDRPAAIFRPISVKERAKFLSRLPETAQYAQDLSSSSKTPWKLIVSSTSWTADEDFSLLLDALCAYSAEAASKTHLPKILAIITGKGPQKEYYLDQVRKLNQETKLLNVVVQTAWLTPEDYALLLASADLGVSLHTSSSGVDLPMKVVDMFGAGLPVVGWGKFEAWPELVKEDINGKGFSSASQLASQLMELFDRDDILLKKLKQGALKESESRWDDEWDRVGGKLFKLT
ncbi:glycosyl transferases group 1-domain-containing protein [Phaeosphaeriaceae sp. PMI808]|nr:glycosyl transferases group 1-domain-containing protein [Phaeosphaeriaceae sp. PMI808]